MVKTYISLNNKYKIYVRGGLHCAPLAHKFLSTTKTGAVRISLNHFNNKRQIKTFIKAIKKINESNSFVVSFEKLNDEHTESYFIGVQGNDAQDLTIQFLKLIDKKINKIQFFNEKKSAIVELLNKNQFLLILNHNQIPLSRTEMEVLITSSGTEVKFLTGA